MNFIRNPFFWAFVSMSGLLGATAVVSSRRLGKSTLYGFLMVGLFDLGRFMLVIPFCAQPRFETGLLQTVPGGIILFIGICFGLLPCFAIRPLNAAEEKTELAVKGFYTYTRNPIYLGEILMCLGWALIHGSIIGLILVPLWWLGLLLLIVLEEESLERVMGQTYSDYRRRVKGRIIPGLPV